jgi:hypothetical protein
MVISVICEAFILIDVPCVNSSYPQFLVPKQHERSITSRRSGCSTAQKHEHYYDRTVTSSFSFSFEQE